MARRPFFRRFPHFAVLRGSSRPAAGTKGLQATRCSNPCRTSICYPSIPKQKHRHQKFARSLHLQRSFERPVEGPCKSRPAFCNRNTAITTQKHRPPWLRIVLQESEKNPVIPKQRTVIPGPDPGSVKEKNMTFYFFSKSNLRHPKPARSLSLSKAGVCRAMPVL